MVTGITRAATLEAAMEGSPALRKAVQAMDLPTRQAWSRWWPSATPQDREGFQELYLEELDPRGKSVPMITHGNRTQLPGARPRRH